MAFASSFTAHHMHARGESGYTFWLEEQNGRFLVRIVTHNPAPCGTERVENQCIADAQHRGVDDDLISVRNCWIKREAPGFVTGAAAAVLTRVLSAVTVAVKPSV